MAAKRVMPRYFYSILSVLYSRLNLSTTLKRGLYTSTRTEKLIIQVYLYTYYSTRRAVFFFFYEYLFVFSDTMENFTAERKSLMKFLLLVHG